MQCSLVAPGPSKTNYLHQLYFYLLLLLLLFRVGGDQLVPSQLLHFLFLILSFSCSFVLLRLRPCLLSWYLFPAHWCPPSAISLIGIISHLTILFTASPVPLFIYQLIGIIDHVSSYLLTFRTHPEIKEKMREQVNNVWWLGKISHRSVFLSQCTMSAWHVVMCACAILGFFCNSCPWLFKSCGAYYSFSCECSATLLLGLSVLGGILHTLLL